MSLSEDPIQLERLLALCRIQSHHLSHFWDMTSSETRQREKRYRIYRLKSLSFTIAATICFTYSSVMRKTFSGPEAVMRSE